MTTQPATNAPPAHGGTTRRLGHGLAVNPEADLAMFSEMARHGHHLAGIAAAGHGWRFADGPAEDVVFDLAYADDAGEDYFDLFRAAGWQPVLSVGRTHIFRAPRGTAPVHSGADSRRDELLDNHKRYVRHSLLALAVLAVAVVLLLVFRPASWLVAPVLCLFAIPVCYTVIPLVAMTRRLGRTPDAS